MKRVQLLVGVFCAMLVTGCGSGSSESADHNAAAIAAAGQQAEDAASAEAEILKVLRRTYTLHHYAGVDNVFQLENDHLCDISDVKPVDFYPLGAPDDELLSPDGNIVVSVNYFIDTEGPSTPDQEIEAECLFATKEALDW